MKDSGTKTGSSRPFSPPEFAGWLTVGLVVIHLVATIELVAAMSRSEGGGQPFEGAPRQ